jgi:hypothetical protein
MKRKCSNKNCKLFTYPVEYENRFAKCLSCGNYTKEYHDWTDGSTFFNIGKKQVRKKFV